MFGGAKCQGEGEAEVRGTDEQPLPDKPPLIRCVDLLDKTHLFVVRGLIH